MGLTYRFIADPSLPVPVLAWLRALPDPPEEIPTERGIVLHFSTCGKLSHAPDGKIIGDESPVATLFVPRVERGVLWTVGELHFLASRMRDRFPELAKISAGFAKWLKTQPCVFSNEANQNEFSYYLEGSIRNYDPPIYAFDTGLTALSAGQYFVGDSDNEYVTGVLCRALRLRGVNCTD